MGYTHYWTQTKDFTREEWVQIREDMEALLKDVEHVQGIPLANGMGEPGTSPEISDDKIWFNGVGDDSHETFCLNRKPPPKEPHHSRRGWDFCKTYRRLLRPGRHCSPLLPLHRVRSGGLHGRLRRSRQGFPRTLVDERDENLPFPDNQSTWRRCTGPAGTGCRLGTPGHATLFTFRRTPFEPAVSRAGG